MGLVRFRLELGVELAGDVEAVAGELDDFHESFLGADGADDEAFFLELVLVVGIELVAVAVTLGDTVGIVIELRGLRSCEKDGLAGAEAHVVAHGGEFFLLFLQADDGVRGVFIELGGVRTGEAADVAGEFDGGDLHAETDAEVGDIVLAGVLGGEDFSFDAAIAETAGNEDAIDVADDFLGALVFECLGIDADDLDFGVVRGTGMDERLVNRFVGVLQLGVFSGDGDGDAVLRMDHALHESFPFLEGGSRRVAEADFIDDEAVDFIAAQVERAFVNAVIDIAEGDDVLFLDVAEHGDFLAVVLIEIRLGTADDDVRLDADFAQLGDGLLGRFGFDFACGFDEREQGDVDEADVVLADFQCELTQGFEEEQAFHVADRAADFRDENIDVFVVVRHFIDARFDFIGDVRDELHGFAEVVTAAFFFDDGIEDLTGGEVVHAR